MVFDNNPSVFNKGITVTAMGGVTFSSSVSVMLGEALFSAGTGHVCQLGNLGMEWVVIVGIRWIWMDQMPWTGMGELGSRLMSLCRISPVAHQCVK